jgi:thiamine-monophosphate kinase
MGATPRLALLSLALPPTLPLADFDDIIGGLAALAGRHRMSLVGGNLTRTTGPLVIDVTVGGSVKRRQILTRGGARPGDDLYVTGTIGAAAAGLQMLKATATPGAPPLPPESSGPCIRRYLYPEPRVRLGTLVGRNRAATACIDLSDGLADAVHQVAAASRVGAIVDAAELPIDPDARRWFAERGTAAVREALTASDDYELLIAVGPRTRGRLRAAERHGDVPLTRIGSCTAEPAVLLRSNGTTEPMPRGYSHFRQS